MILWTIQPLTVWKALQSKGQIQAREVFVDKHFRPAYRWMRDQMRLRLGPPPSSNSFPLWAWYQWQGASKKRPDLRFSGHLPSGETGVLIEFLAEADEVLLSDFELWHYVLNYLYLPSSSRDEAQFDSVLSVVCSQHSFGSGEPPSSLPPGCPRELGANLRYSMVPAGHRIIVHAEDDSSNLVAAKPEASQELGNLQGTLAP